MSERVAQCVSGYVLPNAIESVCVCVCVCVCVT